VRPQQQPLAETLRHLAIGIELHNRIDIGTGAGIGAATIPGPDALAVNIHIDGTQLIALTEPICGHWVKRQKPERFRRD